MKIVRRGTGGSVRTACKECNAVLLLEPGDVKHREYFCCGKPESGYFYKCAACGASVEIEVSRLSQPIIHAANGTVAR